MMISHRLVKYGIKIRCDQTTGCRLGLRNVRESGTDPAVARHGSTEELMFILFGKRGTFDSIILRSLLSGVNYAKLADWNLLECLIMHAREENEVLYKDC
jgi:hypothetical protein